MPSDEQIRRQAWLGLVDTDRDTLYLTLFSNKMRRLHRITSWIVAVGSTAALSTFILTVSRVATGEQLNPETAVAGSAISLLVVGISIWAVVSDFSKKAMVASTIADECRKIALSWRGLWAEIDGLDDGEALDRTQNLERLACEVTKEVPHSLGIHRRLNEKCADQTYEAIKHEYPEAA